MRMSKSWQGKQTARTPDERQPVGWVSSAPFKNRTQRYTTSEQGRERGSGQEERTRTDTDRLAGKETEVFSVDTELNLDEIKSNMAAAANKV